MLTTLGYKLNVGRAQNNANPNSGGVEQLPKVEAGTDEIAAPLFVKANAGEMMTLSLVARFSPKGPLPFGWYPKGSPSTHNPIATAAQIADGQTSDKARMVLPPVVGSPIFDPGTATFGFWLYSDQKTQMYDSGSASNGDYVYSEDAPNSPANVHRTKVYPLKDSAGVAIANRYLVTMEEAANGDYQDFVFVLSNAKPAN